ncbi:MAG: hypothetical protein P4M00_23650 [Azospirillaceae bacterium]|nr:hypothetical protein [Azospirillaceae bacterium]
MPDLIATIKAARNTPAGFAFGFGKTPDSHALIADPHRAGNKLFDDLKRDGMNKGFWGQVQIDGGTAFFTCEGGQSNRVEAALKEWAHWVRPPFKVAVKEPDAGDDKSKAASQTPVQPDPKDTQNAKDMRSTHRDGESEEEDDDDKGPFSTALLVKCLAAARKREIPFAFGYGKTPDLNLLLLHRRYEWERLVKLVRAENHAAKGAGGMVSVTGSLATFACAAKPPSDLRKALLRYFKEHELAVKVRVLGPDNTEFDDDEETAVLDEGADKKRLEAIRVTLETLADPLRALTKAHPDRAALFQTLFRDCVAAMRSQNADAAEPLLRRLQAEGAAAIDDTAERAAEAPKAWSFADEWEPAAKAWRQAVASIEHQLSSLRTALLNSEDDDLEDIADFGLASITESYRDDLMDLVNQVSIDPDAVKRETVGAMRALISGFRELLRSSPRVAACDDNPFGVAMALRETLEGAMDKIEAALSVVGSTVR